MYIGESMKTRHGFVSNSSSSSFIISGKTEFDEDFKTLIHQCVFYIELDIGREKDTLELYDNLMGLCDVGASGSKRPFHADYDPRGVVGISDFSKSSLDYIFDTAKKYDAKVRLSTGGTSSVVLPQAMIQSYLIDKNISYHIEGDGSFDMRKYDEIEKLLEEYSYPGPCGALLRYYHGQSAGDENPSE